jgi:hypothetical protein
MRFSLCGATAVLLLLGSFLLSGGAAKAGLITTPPNTVNALFFLGAHAGTPEIEDFGTPPGAGPAPIGPGGVDFVEGAIDGSTIHVGDTQIVITNQLAAPFCSVTATPCPDSFTGFEFQFSSGVDITGVSVDPATAPDFLPNTIAPHAGLQLLSPTDILVDVTGDAPKVGDDLIIDVTTAGTTPISAVSEPSSIWPLLIGLFGLLWLRTRCRQRKLLTFGKASS